MAYELRPIDAETILLALDFFRDNLSPALPESHKVVTRGAIEGARARFLALPQVRGGMKIEKLRGDIDPRITHTVEMGPGRTVAR